MEGKNFLITGAANGIGLEYTRMVLRSGGRVVMTDINRDMGEARLKELQEQYGTKKISFSVLNVTDEDQWSKVWDEAESWLGDKVDVLMNNAGVFSRSNWRPMNDINLTGLLIGTYMAIQRMGLTQGRGNRGGTVVQTASLAGLLTTGWTSHTEYTYTATKHAVVALTRGLNDKTCSTWREDRVRVMAVCPWVVDTDLVREGLRTMDPNEYERKSKSWVHKFIQPNEVAEAVGQLVREGAPGEVITLGPNNTVYTFPDVQPYVFLACKLCHSILRTAGLVRDSEVVSVNKLAVPFLIVCLLSVFMFHVLLNFLGI